MNEQTDKQTDGQTDSHWKYTLNGINLNCLSEEGRKFVLFSHSFCEICSRNNVIFHQTWIKKTTSCVLLFKFHKINMYIQPYYKVASVCINQGDNQLKFSFNVFCSLCMKFNKQQFKGFTIAHFHGILLYLKYREKKNHWNKSTHLKMKY